jgi:hypothetical protein
MLYAMGVLYLNKIQYLNGTNIVLNQLVGEVSMMHAFFKNLKDVEYPPPHPPTHTHLSALYKAVTLLTITSILSPFYWT